MRLWQSTCTECGWVSKAVKSRPVAEYAYTRHSCDAQRLRAEAKARGEQARAAVDRTPKPCEHKQARHRHGTHACYVLDRCRCWPCAKANTAYENNRTRQTAYGRWTSYVDAQPAREHVRELTAAGMGLKRIVAVSGLSQGVLWKLVYGKRGPDGTQRPSERIRPETERRLLATTVDLADGAKVDPTGAVRRVQALVAIGWSQSRIAAEIGMMPTNFAAVSHGRRRVTVATDTAIRALYDRWSMSFPPETGHREKISVSRSRSYAKRHGWLPPLAWDDERIDDPTAAPLNGDDPTGVDEVAIERRMAGDLGVRLSHDERLALVERLTAQGLSGREIAARTGYHPRQVVRDRSELRTAVAA